MKGVFVIIDGLGDRPCKKLKGKTPLEDASTPNMDYLASKGEVKLVDTVKKGFVPGTSEGVISLFGLDWKDYPRGWLEALGAGLSLQKGDLALRVNFATIENLDSKKLVDRRAGRDLKTDEAEKLGEALNRIKLKEKFIFKPTLQHRGVLVFRGGFSDNITPTDPEYLSNKEEKFVFSVAEDDEDLSEYSANLVNNFSQQAFKILDNHEVNIKRRKQKKLPANIIITREAGINVKRLNTFNNWGCTSSVPVMKGICKSLGITLTQFESKEFKKDIYKNLYKNLKLEIEKAKELIKNKDKDYFLVYFKEPDTPGHDGLPLDKKKMIEIIDKEFFSFIKKMEKEKVKIIVGGDHSTPCELGEHSDDPVPFLFCDWRKNKERKFSEKECRKGNRIKGGGVLDFFK